jgi:hypothetical protein
LKLAEMLALSAAEEEVPIVALYDVHQEFGCITFIVSAGLFLFCVRASPGFTSLPYE